MILRIDQQELRNPSDSPRVLRCFLRTCYIFHTLNVVQVHMHRSSVLILATAILILAGLPAYGRVPPQSDELKNTLDRAVRLHQSGNIEGAIREYEAFFEEGAESAGVRSNLGAAYADQGRYKDAIEQYRRALALEEKNPTVRFNLGVAYYKTGQIPRAAEQLKAVIAGQPANRNAMLLLADCHLRMGSYKEAIELLSPLQSAQDDNLALLYLLGTALIRDHQVEKGQVLVDRILRNGESAEAHVMLGTAYLDAHELPDALKEFQRAVELNPNLPTVHSLQGRALMATGSPEAAKASFRRELESNTNDFDSNLYLGILLKQEQNHEAALSYIEKALLLRPGAPEVRYQLGSLHLATGNIAEAQRILEELVSDTPSFVEAHVSLATVYYRQKRKADGDRHRAIVQELNAEIQARAPGAQERLGPGYRGEATTEIPRAPKEEDTQGIQAKRP